MTCALGGTEVCRAADGAHSLMEAVGANQMAVLQKQGCQLRLVPWRERASAVCTETGLQGPEASRLGCSYKVGVSQPHTTGLGWGWEVLSHTLWALELHLVNLVAPPPLV